MCAWAEHVPVHVWPCPWVGLFSQTGQGCPHKHGNWHTCDFCPDLAKFPHLTAISAFFPFSGPALETTLSFHGMCLAATMFCMPAGLYFIHQQPCLEQCLIFWLPFVVISSFVQRLCALMSISPLCARETAARQKSPKDFCFPFPHEFRPKEVLEEYFLNNSALVGQCPPCQAGGQHWYRTTCSPEANRNLIWGNSSCSTHSFTPLALYPVHWEQYAFFPLDIIFLLFLQSGDTWDTLIRSSWGTTATKSVGWKFCREEAGALLHCSMVGSQAALQGTEADKHITEKCVCLWHILPKAESVKHLEVGINSVSTSLVFLLPILLKMTARPKISKLIYHSNRISCCVTTWRTNEISSLAKNI